MGCNGAAVAWFSREVIVNSRRPLIPIVMWLGQCSDNEKHFYTRTCACHGGRHNPKDLQNVPNQRLVSRCDSDKRVHHTEMASNSAENPLGLNTYLITWSDDDIRGLGVPCLSVPPDDWNVS